MTHDTLQVTSNWLQMIFFVLILLSAHVKRFSVSWLRDSFLSLNYAEWLIANGCILPSGGDSSLSSGRVARKGASLSSFQDLVLVREFLKKKFKSSRQ